MTSTGPRAAAEPLTPEQIQALPTYDWEIAQVGDTSPPFTYAVTEASIADYCLAVKDSVGVEPYALSMQNEPAFSEPYESCVYYAEELNELITLIGPKLQERGLTTRLFGSEHMFWDRSAYAILTENPYLYAYAVHGYTNGVDPDYGTASEWGELKTIAGSNKVWMTETTAELTALAA